MTSNAPETPAANADYLSKAAALMATSSPALSRFYMDAVLNQRYDPDSSIAQQSCQYCGSIFNPNNQRLRFRTRMKLTKKIKKLQHACKETGGRHRLSGYQKRMLSMYQQSSTDEIIFCKLCSRKSRIHCCGQPSRTIKADSRKAASKSGDSAREAMSKSKKKKMKKKRKAEEKALLNSVQSPSMLLSNTSIQKEQNSNSTLRNEAAPNFRASSSSDSSFRSPVTHKHQSPSSASLPSSASKSSKKKRNKDSMMKLQKMLNQQNSKNSSSSSLHSFLSSL